MRRCGWRVSDAPLHGRVHRQRGFADSVELRAAIAWWHTVCEHEAQFGGSVMRSQFITMVLAAAVAFGGATSASAKGFQLAPQPTPAQKAIYHNGLPTFIDGQPA